jgi:hypothetical protein
MHASCSSQNRDTRASTKLISGSFEKAEYSGPALVGLSRLGINLEYDPNSDVESRLPILKQEFDARRKTHKANERSSVSGSRRA